MMPRHDTKYRAPSSKEKSQKEISVLEKSAYFLFSGATSTLITLLSLLLIFAITSLLTTGAISRITIPKKIPTWSAAIILLITYTIIVLPLKALRFKFSPHKPYSLYGSRQTPKYGDATLWLALFILLAWYVSEHRLEIQTFLGNFPEWWRNFVDTVGPWFYR